METINQKIAKILSEIEEMLEINSIPFKPKAYKKAARVIENLKEDIGLIYKKGGIKALMEIPGVGKSIAKKIEEFLKKGKIKYYEELREKTAIRAVITHYFKTKDVSLEEKAKEAIDKVAQWAKSRGLDYAIETVFKKWLELDRLKPKEIVKKPYYEGNPMVWSQTHKKWYVIDENGEWLEFAGDEKDIEWRTMK